MEMSDLVGETEDKPEKLNKIKDSNMNNDLKRKNSCEKVEEVEE